MLIFLVGCDRAKLLFAEAVVNRINHEPQLSAYEMWPASYSVQHY